MSSTIQSNGYSRTEAYNYITQRKNEIIENMKNGNPQNKIQIGGKSYSKKEWDQLMKKVDVKIDAFKKEEKEEAKEKEQEDQKDKSEQKNKNDSLAAYHALNNAAIQSKIVNK